MSSLDLAATLTLRRQQRRAEAESKSKLDARPGWDITTTTPTIVRKVPPPRFNSRAPPPPRRKKRTPRRTTDSSPPVPASAVSPDGAWAALFAADAAAAATAEAQPWTPEPERVPAEALQAVRAGVAQDVQPDEVKLVKEVDKLALRPAVASALKGIKSRMLRRRAVHEQLFAWMDDPATQEEVAVATDGGDTASDGGVQQARPLSVHTNGAGGAAAAGEASPRSTGSGAAKRLRRRRVARKQGQQRPGWNATTLVEPPKRALVHTILKDDDLELMLAQEEKPAKEFPEELYYASVSDQLRGEVMQAVEDEEFLQRHAGQPTPTHSQVPRCFYAAPKSAKRNVAPRTPALPRDITAQVRMVVQAAEEKEKEMAQLEARRAELVRGNGDSGRGRTASVASHTTHGTRIKPGLRSGQRGGHGSTSWQRGSFFGMYSDPSVTDAAVATAQDVAGGGGGHDDADAALSRSARRRRRRRNFRESLIRPEDAEKHREYERRHGYDSGVRPGANPEQDAMRTPLYHGLALGADQDA